MKKTLIHLGEFGIIDKIRRSTRVNEKKVRVGIGDDTAVLFFNPNKELLFTTDMLIENRHFRLSEATAFEIGRKALAVNLSDIAAMGGTPCHAVIAVGLPKKLSKNFAGDLYSGIQSLARQFNVSIVGGDTNQSDYLVLSVALMGEAEKNKSILRSGAKIGDIVFVTGSLGGSYESKKHLNFMPRIYESQFLVSNFKINAMMDISDGLSSDLYRMSEESKVGFRIMREALPFSNKKLSINNVLNDGEDFELLFTMSPREAQKFILKKKPKNLTPFHVIGIVTSANKKIKLVDASKETIIHQQGFNHFRN